MLLSAFVPMTWLHFTNTERFQRDCEIRRELAEAARRALERDTSAVVTVRDGFELAAASAREFERLFNEPLPQQLDLARKLELTLWRRVQVALEKPPNNALRARLSKLLLILTNVLHAQEEMMTNCLTTHYVRTIQALHAEAASIRL